MLFEVPGLKLSRSLMRVGLGLYTISLNIMLTSNEFIDVPKSHTRRQRAKPADKEREETQYCLNEGIMPHISSLSRESFIVYLVVHMKNNRNSNVKKENKDSLEEEV